MVILVYTEDEHVSSEAEDSQTTLLRLDLNPNLNPIL